MTAPLTSRPQETTPQTYKISIGWRVFFGLLGGVCLAGGGAGAFYFGTGHEVHSAGGAILLPMLCLAFAAMGLYVAVWAVRSRVLLRSDGIESVAVFRSRYLRNEDIAGWRTVQQSNAPSEVVIVPRDVAGRRMKLSQAFAFDATFDRWLAQFQNLDLKDESESVEQMMTDPGLGTTVEQRSEKVVQARRVSRVFTILTFCVGGWAWFYPEPYSLVTALLIALPAVALLVALASNGLYRLDKKKNDAHPDLAIPFVFPGFILLLRAVTDFEFLHWGNAVVLALVLGIALCAFATVCDPSLRGKYGTLAALLFCTSVYGMGTTFALNAEFDRSQLQIFRAEVISKHISHGKHTDYRLELSSWGPQGAGHSVSVSRAYFDSVRPGDEVCTFLRSGALHIPWYRIGTCPTE